MNHLKFLLAITVLAGICSGYGNLHAEEMHADTGGGVRSADIGGEEKNGGQDVYESGLEKRNPGGDMAAPDEKADRLDRSDAAEPEAKKKE